MDVYSAGMSYEAELLAEANKRGRIWQYIGLASLVGMAGFAILAGWAVSQHTVTSHVISVDKATGMAEVLSVTQMRSIPMQGLEAQAYARRYVESRERYFHNILKADYNSVLALSDANVGRVYDADIRDKESRLKGTVEEYVEIRSVQLPPDQVGRAVIRFEKRTATPGRPGLSSPRVYIATLAYTFVSAPTGSVNSLTLNPLGFKVLAYVVQAEMGDPR